MGFQYTPLHHATSFTARRVDNLPVIAYLLELGADIKIRSRTGLTPFLAALLSMDDLAVNYLVKGRMGLTREPDFMDYLRVLWEEIRDFIVATVS